ncbi:biotin transporter BioY [Pseudoruegeria sp. SK021]|uniref:biotin transporter BioY n=1 Tax=Pseudoruegeria sp. SK021 TaxID=1933035 RepID=UPI000A2666D6|nr:biotin transporter BioY [Pseudoruegeria sp. SK021]OSP54474.1 biotin transporter BioY [Pseudoruegeria sp. SK021]
MTRETTLSQALMPTSSLLKTLALVAAGSGLVALGAQVDVPMFPVPMSLQTLAISAIGLTYGSRLAGLTMLAYLAEGAMGLPVFAGGGAGLAHLFGPTAGYLFGFMAMAWLTGLMVERGFSQGIVKLSVAALIPATLLFVPGALWLWAVTPLSLSGAFAAGVLPFLVGGVVKSVLAAVAVTGGWSLLRRRG